jgi:hypothetical protein
MWRPLFAWVVVTFPGNTVGRTVTLAVPVSEA